MSNPPRLELKEIIGTLKKGDSTCYVSLDKVKLYEISPAEFLSFARQDLAEGSERGKINAISNAKRAIACRVDEILTLWNLMGFSYRNRWGLPYKLLVLKKLGITAPDVLRDYITSKRNQIEHDYIRPTSQEETRYLADITELFLSATDTYVKNGYITSATIINKYEEERQKINSRLDRILCVEMEYKLKFDFKSGVLMVTSQEFDCDATVNLHTGEIKQRKKALNELPDVSNITINDCKEADVTEFMKLLFEKAP